MGKSLLLLMLTACVGDVFVENKPDSGGNVGITDAANAQDTAAQDAQTQADAGTPDVCTPSGGGWTYQCFGATIYAPSGYCLTGPALLQSPPTPAACVTKCKESFSCACLLAHVDGGNPCAAAQKQFDYCDDSNFGLSVHCK